MNHPISDKPVVKYILEHCYARGVKHVILSPGSRNAPFILSFPASGHFDCLTIVDERSAAYFALGLARRKNEPVAVVCTSGTAALNYAPAIAEAYYQQIPLIVITADRPPELIDQADGQAIRQNGIYHNFIRYECQAPSGELSEAEARHFNRELQEAFLQALGAVKGPVHINVPLSEPLYGRAEVGVTDQNWMIPMSQQNSYDDRLVAALLEEVRQYNKVLLVVGAMPGPGGWQELVRLMARKGVVVLAETLSNIQGSGIIVNVDRALAGIPDDKKTLFQPDLLITLDVPVLSKMLKKVLKTYAPKAHWHFCNQKILVDTYGCLTRQIEGPALDILTGVVKGMDPRANEFSSLWQKVVAQTTTKHEQYLKKLCWSDLQVFEYLASALPGKLEIHLSNSTPVRYAQLFGWKQSQTFYGNRGTSGIDGCVSTAAGAAYVGASPVTLITGDLAFFYDSNGLWHRYLPASFRVIVINNGGGGIFRFIPGPTDHQELESFFEARNQNDCRGLAQTFGLDYHRAEDEKSLKAVLDDFWQATSNPALLEVFTPTELNGEILRDYFKALKEENT